MKRNPVTPPSLCPTEYEEQCRVVAWARRMSVIEPRLRLLRAGMEGVRLPIGLRRKCKTAGMDSGWPDLFLSVPRWHEFKSGPKGDGAIEHGLYIELKRLRGSVLGYDQKEMHELLREQGYRVEICRGADAAITCIMDYLGLSDHAAQEPHDTL